VFSAVPYVLRGAFIGAFVILPLGWVASLLRAGLPRFRDGSAAPATIQAIALTTCIALLVTSLPYKAESSAASATMSPQERLQALDRSLRTVEDSERESPRDHWDPDYVVNMVGRDPQRLFAWVRDNTFWIPYRGVLRGPIGVLMDRQGNSLDRAILLATLLEKTGRTVRLAHGELPPKQVVELLPNLVAIRRARVPAGPSSETQSGIRTVTHTTSNEVAADDDVAAVTAHFQPVAAALGTNFTVGQEKADGSAKEVVARVSDETTRLLSAVQPSDSIHDWSTRYRAATKALSDHWWVQLLEGQNWNDLDLLSASQGALTTQRETAALHQLAGELYHQIAIRVMAEQASGATTTTHQALAYTFRAAETLAQPIVLQFWPTGWISDVSGVSVRHTPTEAAAQDQWAAALSIGKETAAMAFLAESGAAEETKGGVFGGLGSAMAGALAGQSKPQELSAVWIEYEVRVPGQQPQIARRTVFDLLGAAARAAHARLPQPLDTNRKLARGLALMMRTEILPIVSEIPSNFVHYLVEANLVANKNVLSIAAGDDAVELKQTAASAGPESQQDMPERLLGAAAPPPSPLLALASARLQSGGTANPAFISHPNIVTRHRFFVPSNGGQVSAVEAVDIVANEVEVDLATREAFAIRLWQGVLDTNLEASASIWPSAGNAGLAFAKAPDWLTLNLAQRSRLGEISLPEEARRRIAQDLDSGYVVVAPRAAMRIAGELFVGWWRINPRTGDALGVDARGWGTSATERMRLSHVAAFAIKSFMWEYAMCQFGAQVINGVKILNEVFFDSWHPSWVAAAAHSEDPMAVARAGHRACLVMAITMGALATLPLLLLVQRWRRAAMLRAAEAEAAAVRARIAARAKKMDPAAFEKTDPNISLRDTHVDPPREPPGPTPRDPPPTSIEEAQKRLDDAEAAHAAAKKECWKATQEWIRYGQKGPSGNPNYAAEGLEPWHPSVEEALANKADAADQASVRAGAAVEAAKSDLYRLGKRR
jgi:hypothetical protein